jgi:type II secretory pathway pseudopilin PulG
MTISAIKKNTTGFTLLELMFAAAILAATVIIILGIFFGCSHLNEDFRYFVIAANDARFIMEEIKSASLTSLSDATNAPGGFSTWGNWAVALLANGGGGLNTTDRPDHGLEGQTVTVSFPRGTAADPLEVEVRVNFQGRRQKINPTEPHLSVILRTLMTNV